MTELRFLCKTNKYGITTTFTVVVMLLLFMASCGGDHKEVVTVAFDPETTYTMKATDVSSLISDSGVTRYRMNAKEWLVYGKAKEPFSYFPEGVYVEKFDTLFNVEASVKADTAYYWDKKGLYKLVGHVEVLSLEGKELSTSILYIDQNDDKIHTDQYFELLDGENLTTGIGFESNQTMTKYKIFESGATISVTDRAPADSTQVNMAPGDSVVVDVAKTDSIKTD